MAIKEARCGNCGSIIRVDEKAERAICAFCGAKTPTEEAFAIQKNPDAYTFPNEKQEALTEEELKEALSGHRGAGGKFKLPQVAASPKANKPAQPTAAERVAQLDSKPVEIKPLGSKTVLLVASGVLVFVGVIIALILPPFFTREHKREALQTKIKDIMPAAVAEEDQRYMIDGQANSHLRVISPTEVTAEEARDLAGKFQQARAAVYDLDVNAPQPKTVVDLISEAKSYRVIADEVKEVAGINPASIVKEKGEKKEDKAAEQKQSESKQTAGQKTGQGSAAAKEGTTQK